MTDACKDGGPAFPNPGLADPTCSFQSDVSGMTLRDWFAGQALHYTLDRARSQQKSRNTAFETKEDEIEAACRWAYDIAVAMVAEKGARNA